MQAPGGPRHGGLSLADRLKIRNKLRPYGGAVVVCELARACALQVVVVVAQGPVSLVDRLKQGPCTDFDIASIRCKQS